VSKRARQQRQTQGTRVFETWPLDAKTFPPTSRDILNKKGGSEMAIRSKRVGPVLMPGTGTQHWDVDGSTFLKDGKTVFFGFRFKVEDVSMLTEKVAKSFYLFQQHSIRPRTNVDFDCIEAASDGPNVGGFAPVALPDVAPTAAMLIGRVKDTDELELRFYTKNRDADYYRSVPLAQKSTFCGAQYSMKVCDNSHVSVCGDALWKARVYP